MFMSTTKSTLSSHDTPTTVRLNEGVKEARAHEHARHRTKERREHALAKERKEKAATVRVLGLKGGHPHATAHGAKLVRRLSMESWDGKEPDAQAQHDSDALVQGHRAAVLADAENKDDVAPPRDTALTLGDILSRPRQPKVKQLDFEVIPPIRAVIALDDADEPWEYITRASVSDGSAWKGKSYAQAVVSAM